MSDTYIVDREGIFVAEIPEEIVESSGYIGALAPFLSKRDRRCLERGLVTKHQWSGWVIPRDGRGTPGPIYYFSKYAT